MWLTVVGVAPDWLLELGTHEIARNERESTVVKSALVAGRFWRAIYRSKVFVVRSAGYMPASML